MSERRVIAYFMHEAERAAALEKMKDVKQTEGYVLGRIAEEDIPGLERRGCIVQILDEPPPGEMPEVQPRPLGGFRGGTRGVTRGGERVAPGPAGRAIPAGDIDIPNFYLVQLAGPVLEEWRGELALEGVRFLEGIPPDLYTAYLEPEQVSRVQALPFVRSLRVYGPEETGPVPGSRGAAAPPPAAVQRRLGLSMLTFDVLLHREADLPKVWEWMRDSNVNVAGASGRKLRVYLLEGSPLVDRITALPEVSSFEEFVPPKLHNDLARVLLGLDSENNPGLQPILSERGEGQIIAVADTGLDESHPDFQGRVAGVVARGRRNDASDPHGHGTHVAGSVLGDGGASGGLLRGAAPEARLFFQSLLDPAGDLGGLPLDLGDLFEEAYQAGARIHNNSWGSSTQSMYTINSIEVDGFVAGRRDMLVVISAGNAGTAAVRRSSQVGFVDWLSIDSPASCKNALTVGAGRSSRTNGGLAALTYQQAWPDDFPDDPIAGATVSGDPEALAAFSSRGPCDDYRIKPDLVAPGTDIASAKSSLAPLRHFWGPYPGNARYAFMGGTSMSAPLVAGCAALVREYYVKSRTHVPSAALVKATLINAARMLTGADALADHRDLPNYHQGFGALDMRRAIPHPAAPSLKLEFVDTLKDPPRQFSRSGQRLQFRLDVAAGHELRICMAYTDLPGRGLQNNLNLLVEDPRGRKWLGNEGLPMSLRIPDPTNNVEVVRFESPPAGTYLVQVTATNLLRGPQDFALVATGDLRSPLAPA